MKYNLQPTSPIYPLLSNLSLMNREVGADDITCDKDYKHVLKRFRNLTLWGRGFKVHGVHIYTSVLWAHLRQNGASNSHITSILKPDDKQDVKLAYDLLHDIWSLPAITQLQPSLSAGFQAKREALVTVGTLFQHILLPYICIDLTLSEQLVHLSAAAHMLLAMLHEDKAGTLLMPTQLYIDVQMMIKNVYFCVAKTKIDNPNGKFWIIVIGTDRLEDKFGIVRVMTGNDTSVDVLQLGIRLTGTTEVSAIFVQHPEWDRSPRRLKLPALSKDGLDIHKGVDHINPASWRGNVEVANVNLQTCWMLGRREVDKIPRLGKILAELEAENNPDLNMLQPFGKDIVHSSRATDDYDDTAEDFHEETSAPPDSSQSCEVPAPDFENAVVEERELHKYDPCFDVDGQKVWKGRYLNERFKEMRKGPASRDRLKRYADIPRYAIKHSGSNTVIESPVDEMEGPCIQMDFPLATVARCEGRLFLCIGEVNDITYNSEHTDRLPVSLLGESTVSISFQVLFLIPTTTEDDPDLKNDWRWSRRRGTSHKVPGRLVEPLNPDLSMQTPLEPCYLFDSGSLSALGALLLGRLTREDVKLTPQIEQSSDFPYREVNGKACFLCEDEMREEELLSKKPCPACTPPIEMPENAPAVLEHVGMHILFDMNINREQEPCGLCLRDSLQCEFYVKKGRGASANLQVQYKKSKCANMMSFSYGHASTSSQSSPCSNVPMPCKWCPSDALAVWKYNMAVHVRSKHPHVSIADNEALWKITHAEQRDMQKKWSERHNVKATR